MLESMPENADPKTENAVEEKDAVDPPSDVPRAFIPACGTLCDAFWWARRSDRKPPSR